jgi:hypothetical protein
VKPLTANRGLRLGVNKINVNLKVSSIYKITDLSANCFRSQQKYLSGSDQKTIIIAELLINLRKHAEKFNNLRYVNSKVN